MPDLSHRSQEIEIMDDLNASGRVIEITLRELETINHLLGGNRVTLSALDDLLKIAANRTSLVVADLGCGSGDILKLIGRSLSRKSIRATLLGIDANPHIVSYAREGSRPEENISFIPMNIFSEEFRKLKFDIVTGTLFFHHFTDEELISFFRHLREQVSVGIIINDIHRHWFAYYSIKWLTHLFSRSAMVRNDAAVSVLRAFKKNELISILNAAGLTRIKIRWMWAFRWQVVVYVQ